MKYVTAVGMIVVDIIAAGLEKLAKPGEIVYITEKPVKYVQGGHPGNVVIDLNQLGIEREKLASVSAVGNDVFGDFLEEKVKKHAEVFYLKTDLYPTGMDLILVVKNEDRRFHISPGANLALTKEYVNQVIEKTKPKILDIRPGYSGIDSEVEDILKYAHEQGAITLLDICRPLIRPGKVDGWQYLIPALKHVDILHCNEHEAMSLANRKDLRSAIRVLRSCGVKNIFVTHGGYGATVFIKNYEIYQPAYKVNVIDPTGAGDAFIAGWEYQMIRRQIYELSEASTEEIIDMLAYAQACGAACVEEIGCTTGVTQEKVQKILRTQGEKLKEKTQVSSFEI